MKIQEIWAKIYPNEAHPLTKAVLVAGIVFIVAIASFALVLGARSIVKSTNYFAALISLIKNPGQMEEAEKKPLSDIKEELGEIISATSTEKIVAENIEEAKPQISGVITPGLSETKIYPVGGVSNFPILPNGIPDLFLQIIDTGIIDDTSNFIHATSTKESQQTGIVFDVWNFGTAVSGTWRFLAELPTFAGNFISEPQKSLAPGEKIRFTIGFRLLTNPGPNNVTVVVDPQNELNELNRVNNVVSATIIRNY